VLPNLAVVPDWITELIKANKWISYQLARLIEDQDFDKNCDLSFTFN